jgi:hypothetical protein
LVEPGKQYAVYFFGGERAEATLALPVGKYRVEWVDTKSGKVEESETLDHAGGNRAIRSPKYSQDIALRVVGQP